MIKKRYNLKCECGKEIIGFSEHHVKKNLEIHKSNSVEHQNKIKLMEGFVSESIDVSKMKRKQLCELLERHPYIIEDIKQIGRLNEKEIMVS